MADKDSPPVDPAEVERLRVRLAEADQRTARLEGRLEAFTQQQQQAEEPREYSAAELDQAVAAGQITQARRDEILDAQRQVRADRRAAKTAQDVVDANRRDAEVQAEIDRYRAVMPDLDEAGSVVRARLETEYKKLLALDYAESKATELVAARAAFGSIEKLERASAGTGSEREPHPETHGGGAPESDGGEPTAETWYKGMTQRERKYHQNMIDKGLETPESIVETMKHANPAVRRRHGARAA